MFCQATRRLSSADRRGWSSEEKKLLTGKVNVSWSVLKGTAGAHPGGNLRVRAFFISYFLSQE